MNESKFSGKAYVYDKARPSYPKEAIDYILSFLPNHVVSADIGSGTGKMTELLLKHCNKVYAVEPNMDMRAVSDERFLGCKSYISVAGNAENTLVPSNSCDCVVVAQALHWFDIQKFRQECARILKLSGKVFIVYNRFYGGLANEYERFLSQNCANFKGLGGGNSNEKIKQFFTTEYTRKIFTNEFVYDCTQFIERALSASYTPKFGDKDYNLFVKEITVFFDKHQKNSKIAFQNETSVCHSIIYSTNIT